MKEFFLPADGSVLVVDDKAEDALPLIELLSSKGLASTYYSGTDDNKLPPRPIQKVRLAFFDIQLFPASTNTASYSANIVRLVDRLVPKNNGPYVLVLWTTIASHVADEVQQRIEVAPELIDKKPLAVLQLEKTTYFKTSNDTYLRDSLIEEIDASLSSRFPANDIDAIQQVVRQAIPPVVTTKYNENAIEKITKDLSDKLQHATDSFQLFTFWESAINRAAGSTVDNFSSLCSSDAHWSNNIKDVIFRMAKAQLGKNVGNVSNDEVLSNALKTMNSTFLDSVEHHYQPANGFSSKLRFDKNNIQFTQTLGGQKFGIRRTLKDRFFQVYIDDILTPAKSSGFDLNKVPSQINDVQKTHLGTLNKAYESITPLINTKLFVDTKPSAQVQPGNIYIKNVPNWRRRISLLRNYYKDRPDKSIVWNKAGTLLLTNKEVKAFKFIELEVSPICDYAQGKWLRYRLLPGIMIPDKYNVELSNSESFYSLPLVKIGGEAYKIMFDFRLLKSVDMSEHDSAKPYFRLRSELSASILSRLSSHASRIGITSVE